jgi:hypothetical protein
VLTLSVPSIQHWCGSGKEADFPCSEAITAKHGWGVKLTRLLSVNYSYFSIGACQQDMFRNAFLPPSPSGNRVPQIMCLCFRVLQ